MSTPSSSSLIDTSLHEDIDDLFIPGLDFDQETLALADEFIRDLDSSDPSSSTDNESINNNFNNDNNSVRSITNSSEYHDFPSIHNSNFSVPSPSPSSSHLDIPHSSLDNDSQLPQSINSDFHVPLHSYPTNLDIPLTPLNNQSQPSQSLYPDSNPIHPQFHNEHNSPITSQSPSHYSSPNIAPSNHDAPDSYWNSNGCVNEFFNFDHPNNSGNGSVVSAIPSPAAPVLNIYAATDPNATSKLNSNDLHPPSGSVEKAQYKQVKKGESSQRGRFFPAILPIDETHSTKQNKGTYQFWFFILQLLMNPSNKSIIIWTGHQRFFRVIDKNALCKLWSTHLGNASDGNWKTAERNIRTCGAKGIMMPVPSKIHMGRNEDGLFGFMMEPSYYVGMTREELDKFIVENCETAPLQSQGIASSNAPQPAMNNQLFQLQQHAPLQQSQELAASTSYAPVMHNQLPQFQQQPQFHQQQFHFQPQMAQPVPSFPYYPNFPHYQQQPPVMHSQFQPTSYRYCPY